MTLAFNLEEGFFLHCYFCLMIFKMHQKSLATHNKQRSNVLCTWTCGKAKLRGKSFISLKQKMYTAYTVFKKKLYDLE